MLRLKFFDALMSLGEQGTVTNAFLSGGYSFPCFFPWMKIHPSFTFSETRDLISGLEEYFIVCLSFDFM